MVLSQNRIPNLFSYKYFIRPTAHRLYGNSRESPKNKHQKNVRNILKVLSQNGPLTTWEMAQIKFHNDSERVRTKEKEYRRILIGRTDRGKRSEGIVDLNLVIKDSKSNKRNPGIRYRLSILGILLCFDILNLTNKEIDKMAQKHFDILPQVFGKWDFLKSNLGESIYDFRLLGKGMIFDNPNLVTIKNNDFFELINYLNTKSQAYSESFTEEKLSEIASYWFYITLIYFPFLKSKTSKGSLNLLQKVLSTDKELSLWFHKFVNEAIQYSEKRFQTIKKLKI